MIDQHLRFVKSIPVVSINKSDFSKNTGTGLGYFPLDISAYFRIHIPWCLYRLNRESRGNRERSRRCNPALFSRRKGNPFGSHIPLFRSIGMGRSLKGRGSQKTCLFKQPVIFDGKEILATNLWGQVNWVQPFKPKGLEGFFCAVTCRSVLAILSDEKGGDAKFNVFVGRDWPMDNPAKRERTSVLDT